MAPTEGFERDQPRGLVWVREGRPFGFEGLVHFAGKGEVPFESVAGTFDLLLTGHHAGAAIAHVLRQGDDDFPAAREHQPRGSDDDASAAPP